MKMYSAERGGGTRTAITGRGEGGGEKEEPEQPEEVWRTVRV